MDYWRFSFIDSIRAENLNFPSTRFNRWGHMGADSSGARARVIAFSVPYDKYLTQCTCSIQVRSRCAMNRRRWSCPSEEVAPPKKTVWHHDATWTRFKIVWQADQGHFVFEWEIGGNLEWWWAPKGDQGMIGWFSLRYEGQKRARARDTSEREAAKWEDDSSLNTVT